MDEKKEENIFRSFDVQNDADAKEIFEQFIAVAHVDSVFGQPLTAGEHTVITASEVSVALGIGYGKGYGSYPSKVSGEVREQSGSGGGGGGGGMTLARPVAAIDVGPQGVKVVPVLDFTKMAMAFLTAVGSMIIVSLRMRRKTRR